MTANESAPGAGNSGGAKTSSAGGGAVEVILPPGSDNAPLRSRADVSLVPPSFGRSTWRAVARCAADGSVTVHRFDDPEGVNGASRTGACGCRYTLRVRRTLGVWGEAA